jgi:hypothetical protein
VETYSERMGSFFRIISFGVGHGSHIGFGMIFGAGINLRRKLSRITSNCE